MKYQVMLIKKLIANKAINITRYARLDAQKAARQLS